MSHPYNTNNCKIYAKNKCIALIQDHKFLCGNDIKISGVEKWMACESGTKFFQTNGGAVVKALLLTIITTQGMLINVHLQGTADDAPMVKIEEVEEVEEVEEEMEEL